MANERYENQKDFWERAGEIGYAKACFAATAVEEHIMNKHKKAAIDLGKELGLNKNSRVLELGCGDGRFADIYLARNFSDAVSFDISRAAIDRAQGNASSPNVKYMVRDAVNHEYEKGEYWDGAFMLGFLHHVKPFAFNIISRLSKVAPKVVVIEPNGDNLLRKTLELTPAYKRAGEDSFKLKELKIIFEENGYTMVKFKKVTFIPPFLPGALLSCFIPLEKIIENIPLLDNLCSTYIMGFNKHSS